MQRPAGGLRFALEAREPTCVATESGWQDFQSHPVPQAGLLGLADGARSPAPDFAHDDEFALSHGCRSFLRGLLVGHIDSTRDENEIPK